VPLMAHCRLVLTDSGGVQEEAPSLGKPVLVMPDTTERPEGVAAGTALLTGTNAQVIVKHIARLLTDEAAYRSMATAENPLRGRLRGRADRGSNSALLSGVWHGGQAGVRRRRPNGPPPGQVKMVDGYASGRYRVRPWITVEVPRHDGTGPVTQIGIGPFAIATSAGPRPRSRDSGGTPRLLITR
jgi:UDP-N-acetylglucosamine 2-epimerase